MKILLIQPPIVDFYITSVRTQPIGLAYLAASLIRKGHEVDILDCVTNKKKSIPIPDEFSYLKEYYSFTDKSPFKLYTGFYHFGMAYDEILERIKQSGARIFGISSNFTPYFKESLQLAKIIKGWDPKKIVVLGGAHASVDPEGVLKNPEIDYVVIGEGELRFPRLIERLEQGEPDNLEGIGFRRQGQISIRPPKDVIDDLDALPYPARELLARPNGKNNPKPTVLITSRGCPHKCAYCSAHHVMGSGFRIRSPETVIEEIKHCREQHEAVAFDIEDDNFTVDRTRAKRLLRLIIDTFGENTLHLSAMNGVSFASLDDELLSLIKKAGFRGINLSYVSADPILKKRMRRPESLLRFDQVVDTANRVGLSVTAYGIFGMPGQSIKEMIDTLIYLMAKRLLIGPSIYYPSPGTPLFLECRQKCILPPCQSQWRSSAFPIETEQFSRLDLITIFRTTRLINFIKARIKAGEFSPGITLHQVFEHLNKEEVEEGHSMAVTWKALFIALIRERKFRSMEKDRRGNMVMTPLKTSEEVVAHFIKKAWNVPIHSAV